jgi:hypothetical protein
MVQMPRRQLIECGIGNSLETVCVDLSACRTLASRNSVAVAQFWRAAAANCRAAPLLNRAEQRYKHSLRFQIKIK